MNSREILSPPREETRQDINPNLKSFLNMVIQNCRNTIPDYQSELAEIGNVNTFYHYFEILSSALNSSASENDNSNRALILENALNQRRNIFKIKLVLRSDIKSQDASSPKLIRRCDLVAEPVESGFNIIYSLSVEESKKDDPQKNEERQNIFELIKQPKSDMQMYQKLTDINIKLNNIGDSSFSFKLYSSKGCFHSEALDSRSKKPDSPGKKAYKYLSNIVLPKFK